MVNIAHWIPIFPFAAFVINICFGGMLKTRSAMVSIVAAVGSLCVAVSTFISLQQGSAGSYALGHWIYLDNLHLKFGILVDPLTVMMLLVVTLVGLLIQIYSIGYMHGDARFSRYFAYLSLFMASMLGLVLADNLLMLYIFWEGVGLCSYLLISFWFERPAAAAAGIKAFITTRVGDTGFLLGIFLLFIFTHTLDFNGIAQLTGHETLLTIVALLIFIGAVGKSAQFPLHVWLPDAMEGPTAVSALIHAATMVAAGVYLVARTFPLFAAHPTCLAVVGIIGAISALMAASIATVHHDIKRVMAYSTISQLGLMMLGLGAGGFIAGTFHLMTHAFFKALLFLCAGSIIHAMHTQDIRQMGGLFSKMKITGISLVIATLAISGIPPLSGFWSKDEILATAWNQGHPVLLVVALLTSLLTAFYMSRVMFLVLFGKPKTEAPVHESPLSMTIPLLILAFLSIVAGFLGSPLMSGAFQSFMNGGSVVEHAPDRIIMVVSTCVSLLGMGWAFLLYIKGVHLVPASIRSRFVWLYQLLSNKFYIDEIYEVLLIRPCQQACRMFTQFDIKVVDGIVNGVGQVVKRAMELIRPLQSGLAQQYLFIQVLGILLIWWTINSLCCRF